MRVIAARHCILRLSLKLAVGAVALALITLIALRIMLPVFHFPTPSGPYEIGTLTYYWVDANRADIFSTVANARRELMVQIWYPAKAIAIPPLPRAPYVQNAYALARALARQKNLSITLFGQLKYITSHATFGAPVADAKPIVPFLAADVSFTINQLAALNQADPNAILTGRLNLLSVGTFGISLGGIVGSEACRIEPRLRACLFMDAPMPVDVVELGLPLPDNHGIKNETDFQLLESAYDRMA